ncbi:hypothetical protein DYH09_24500 [bacterium CPR1]|nr:hypothetical protein [bacterium CPR1]
MLATRIAALLVTAILFMAPARAVELDFQLMDWQPSKDPAVNARIAQRYQLDLSKLPTLQRTPDGLVLTNPGGAPTALAYAPVGMAAGSFTLRFEARSDARRAASARFGPARLDFTATPEWTPHSLTAEAPGPLGPSGVAMALKSRQGTLEVRGLTVVRTAFRIRVQTVPQLVVAAGEGQGTLVGVLVHVAGEVPKGLKMEFRLVPTPRWQEAALGPTEPLAVVTEHQTEQSQVALTWLQYLPMGLTPQTTVFFREPLQPGLLRWRVVDEQGQIIHAGGDTRLGPEPVVQNGLARRAITIREDGVLQSDGRTFFPVGVVLREATPDKLRQVQSLGLNLVQAQKLADPAAFVTRAGKLGIQVVLPAGLTAEQKDFPAAAAARAGQLGNLPFLAWSLVEQPDQRPEYIPLLDRMYVALHQADARPVFQSNHNPASLGLLGQSADIVALDPFPLSDLPSPVSTVATWLDQARLTLPAGRSLWFVNQAFVQSPTWSRPPSFEQLRCMDWLALNHGAKGILYAFLEEGDWKLLDSPLAEAVRRQATEISALEPYLTGEGPVGVDLEGPVDAAIFRDPRGRALLSVVNVSDRNTTGELSLGKVGSVRELPNGPPLPGGTLKLQLSPYQVRLYLLEKDPPPPPTLEPEVP